MFDNSFNVFTLALKTRIERRFNLHLIGINVQASLAFFEFLFDPGYLLLQLLSIVEVKL